MKNNPTTPSAWGIQLAKLWLGCGKGFPVGVKELALEVTKTRFPDAPISIIKGHGISGIDGMLSKRKSKGDWCISYDENVTIPGRINFTLGHEFGHYLLHRSIRDEFRCGQPDILDYNSAASKKQESEANQFASYLLMPVDDFRAQIKGHSITLELLGHCADRYGASLTAAALKWLEFTEEAALLVVADSDDFICWSYSSQSARKLCAYIAPGTPVPQLALDNLRGGLDTKNRVRRVNVGVWHPTIEAEESVILSDRFEMVIFLVRFPLANSVEHEEEDEDAFSFLSERAKGYNWKK